TGKLGTCAEGELEWINNDDLLTLNLWPGDRAFMPLLDAEQFFSGKICYDAGELVSTKIQLH
ncbi:MAG: DNA mismatch repair protein MutT, partial [Planctomycetes bacterium]|nr:DNA mismatch repair protein MutT [Planctomycetota bacterium]